MYKQNRPITKREVHDLKPDAFEPVLSYTRFRNGEKVPPSSPFYSKPRLKREYRPDLGKYVTKMRRP